MKKVANFAQNTGRYYIITITVLSILAGIVVLGFSLWLQTHFKHYDEVARGVAFWGPTTFGALLIAAGSIGLLGILCYSKEWGKCASFFLSLYFGITFVIWIAIVLAIISLLIFISGASKVAESPSYDLYGPEQRLNTWEMAVFNKCCYEHDPSWGDYEVAPCESPLGGSEQEKSGVHVGCVNLTSSSLPCACYTDVNLYDDIANFYTAAECAVVSKMKFNKTEYLINDPSKSGGCGGGQPKQFQKDMAMYLRSHILPAVFIILGISIPMIIGAFCSCCLFYSSGKRKGYSKAGDDAKTVEMSDGTNKLNEVDSDRLEMT